MTTTRERYEVLARLERAGVGYEDAVKLRRIALTLHRWHELECGTGNGQVSYSVERDGDEADSKPFMRVQYPSANGYVDKRYAIADRETGALRRLKAVMQPYRRRYVAYVQSDPRGAALYLVRQKDIPKGASIASYYSRGIAIY